MHIDSAHPHHPNGAVIPHNQRQSVHYARDDAINTLVDTGAGVLGGKRRLAVENSTTAEVDEVGSVIYLSVDAAAVAEGMEDGYATPEDYIENVLITSQDAATLFADLLASEDAVDLGIKPTDMKVALEAPPEEEGSAATASSSGGSSGLSAGGIAGIVIGSICGATLLVVGGVLVQRKRRILTANPPLPR